MVQCIATVSGLAIFVIVLVSVHCSSAANIVILCFPVYSHIIGHANVGKVLQDQGHNVTIAIPHQLQPKLKAWGVNLLMYDSLRNFDVTGEVARTVLESSFHGKPLRLHINFINTVLDQILRDKRLLEDIRTQRPDLIILDSTPPARMLTIIAYKLDVKFMFIGPIAQPQFSRTPILPFVVPNKITGFTDQMTFSRRLVNTFVEIFWYFLDVFSYSTAVSDYAPEKPYISMVDLHAKALLWIVSQSSYLDYNPPTMSNIKVVDHLLTTPKPLPQEFQMFMDGAKNGVVVVSFGSILNPVPIKALNKLLTAFEQTKYSFIMRYSMTMSNSTNSDKLLFSDWLPQFGLLSHKKTRLFITHCGCNGIQEALYSGVPMIGFPVFGDEPHNAASIARNGFGLTLDLRTFAVKDLVSAIREVITNREYRTRVQKASAITRAERVPPVEEAAFWINHVLTFGADHLRSRGQDIPLWQYLGLDILAVCFLVWHILLFIFIKLICFYFGLYQRQKKENLRDNRKRK